MAAFFIVSVNIPNPGQRNAYDEYISRVKPIVENHGGQYLVRSEQVTHMMGAWPPDRVIVIRFETRRQLDTCFSSPEYRAIAPLRADTVTTSAVIVEE